MLVQIDIYYDTRRYENVQRTKVAGIQRMLSMPGYDMGDIDGVLGAKTVDVLNEIGRANQIFGFDFKLIYPVLEQLIAEKQKLDQ